MSEARTRLDVHAASAARVGDRVEFLLIGEPPGVSMYEFDLGPVATRTLHALLHDALDGLPLIEACAHVWGEWEDDSAGAVRVCDACGAVELRPEG